MKTAFGSALVLALLALFTACGRGAPTPADAPADAVYTVRAEIVRLPPAGGGDLYLRHESIPTLRDSKGEVVGMASMTMPFGAPAEVDLSGFQPGDLVEATFEVRWSAAKMPLRVTRLAPLPDGTRLDFDPPDETVPTNEAETAQPPGATPR